MTKTIEIEPCALCAKAGVNAYPILYTDEGVMFCWCGGWHLKISHARNEAKLCDEHEAYHAFKYWNAKQRELKDD